jgi:hypothetical protein
LSNASKSCVKASRQSAKQSKKRKALLKKASLRVLRQSVASKRRVKAWRQSVAQSIALLKALLKTLRCSKHCSKHCSKRSIKA